MRVKRASGGGREVAERLLTAMGDMTYVALAATSKVSKSTICRIAHGQPTRHGNIVKLAAALGVRVWWLQGFNGPAAQRGRKRPAV